jgi:hypothetical protein
MDILITNWLERKGYLNSGYKTIVSTLSIDETQKKCEIRHSTSFVLLIYLYIIVIILSDTFQRISQQFFILGDSYSFLID